MASTVLPKSVVAPRQGIEGRFYFRMAVACITVAVIGFVPTYWVPMFRGTLEMPPLVHVHAFFFYAWTVLFLRQTWLAAAGRLDRHREWGVAGVALATGMVFVGLAMTIHSLERMTAAGMGDVGRAFSIVSASAIALFAGLFTVAVRNVRRPEIHKRVMLVATISLLQAAVGRWFVVFLATPGPTGGVAAPPPLPVTVIPGLLADLPIVIAMVHDRRTRGRVHGAYWIAGGVVLAVQVLRVPFATTAAWTAMAESLLALAP